MAERPAGIGGRIFRVEFYGFFENVRDLPIADILDAQASLQFVIVATAEGF